MPSQEVAKINGFNTAINNGDADVVIYSKPLADDVAAARQARADGAKVVFDIADDHFGDSESSTYREMVEASDYLVCASNVMRGRIFDYTKRDSVVISDPYEQDECEPHADGDSFLWFGHIRNFDEIQNVMHLLGDRRLRLVSGPKTFPQVIQWTPENMKHAFKLSNIALFPTQAGAEYKSPNRLINSIRAGCFPLCMTHPAYLEFKHMAWVGHFPTGLRWVDAFKNDLNGLVKEAQDYVRNRYSPKTIGEQWASFLHGL